MPQAKRTTAGKSAGKTSRASPDAIKMLTDDHAEVKAMFKAYDGLVKADAEDEEKVALATQICDALTVHATVEEEIFYPAARDEIQEQDLLDEAEVEHASAKDLIAQIQTAQPSEPLYDAKIKVLAEYIEHHVKEEEGELFPKVRKSGLDLKALGEELLSRKQELAAEIDEPVDD